MTTEQRLNHWPLLQHLAANKCELISYSCGINFIVQISELSFCSSDGNVQIHPTLELTGFVLYCTGFWWHAPRGLRRARTPWMRNNVATIILIRSWILLLLTVAGWINSPSVSEGECCCAATSFYVEWRLGCALFRACFIFVWFMESEFALKFGQEREESSVQLKKPGEEQFHILGLVLKCSWCRWTFSSPEVP